MLSLVKIEQVYRYKCIYNIIVKKNEKEFNIIIDLQDQS